MKEFINEIPRCIKNKSNFTFWYSIINETNFLINLNNIKNKYCRNNGIYLLRIPYYEYNNIEKILDKHLN